MRILFISYMLGNTASGIISSRILKEFVKQGHEVITLTQDNCVEEIDKSVKIQIIRSVFADDKSILFRAFRKLGRIFQITWFENDIIWMMRCKRKIDYLYLSWQPDCVYCRSTPYEPFYLGKYIKKKYGTKVLMHFTDPWPAVSEYPSKKKFIERIKRIITDLIQYADLLSFGTKEMIEWEECLLNIQLRDRSFESPDVTSDARQRYLECKRNDCLNLVYYGMINVSRNPIPLFTAIEQLRSEGYNCVLKVYSSQTSIYKQYDGVYFMGRNDNRERVFADSDILVDLTIESDWIRDVFVSSKLKDYLLFNRPILSISGNNCSTRTLLSGLKTVVITNNNTVNIKRAIKGLLTNDFADYNYSERVRIIERYTPSFVVNRIVREVIHICKQ